MPDEFQYDVFLSHSSKDKAAVRPLAERLRKDGLKVWFDEWVLKPGDSIPSKIEEGLERSRVLVLCMSAHAFGSDWAQLEAGTFRFRDPLNKERRFIPLRLDDAPIKGSLAQFLYINWLATNRDQEYPKLLAASHQIDSIVSEGNQTDAGWCAPKSQEIVIDRRTRDDFPRKIKEILAKRVGMRCSNPACRRPTSGPQTDPNEIINIGVAAHITAASRGGPRYDAQLSVTARCSVENAIWLCQNCAKLVDSGEARYTVELLRRWKSLAEESARRDVETNCQAAPSGTSQRTRPTSQSDDLPTSEARFRSRTAVVRKLILEALSDDDINTLCQDNFPSVYAEFSSGMTRTQKVSRIIEHCVRRNKLTQLVTQIIEVNPEKYAEVANQLDQ